MMAKARELISVGVDVGTTTTKLVFSRLQIADVARPGRVPRFDVVDKSPLFESDIHFTPLLNPKLVDVSSLTEIVKEEYRNANIHPHQIDTGAVIITGEIARTENANQILQAMAALAGDFIVTVAGPNLEAQIAGRGSGAAAYSIERFAQVTNVDVGGGTANAAIFRIGNHLSSSTLAVGGRQLIIDKTSEIVRHIAPSGQIIIDALGLPIIMGQRVDLESLQGFTDCMADLVADLVSGIQTDLGRKLQLTPPLKGAENSKVLFFSGGVGAYYYQPIKIDSLGDVLIHDDVGPLFARSLRENPRLQVCKIMPPSQTTRATVIGASSQTVTLSGSTIWTGADILPARNLPVVHPQLALDICPSPEYLTTAIQSAIQRWDINLLSTTYAIALDLPERLDYECMHQIAEGLVNFAHDSLAPGTPLVLVIEMDYAQVLGQTINALAPQLPLISVDQIGLSEGDFIDIGEPILDGRIVPLSVKTLIFYD
jgi:ethanolamine utilization protein EutA